MWCEAEIRKALHFVPGYIGFSPEYPQQMGKSFGHQTHHLMREHPLFDGRSSKTNKNPCIRIEMMPSNLERGDSEYQKCSTCTYDRYVRPAGLPSEEMWRVLDLEGQRERKTNEQKNDYKAHESPKTCGLKHCYKKKDSEYEKCSTCTYERSAVRDYDRDLRPAGLPSEEMWRVLDLEGQREPKTKEKETRFETEDRPQTYYSRHKAHFPAHYLHYEGYWDEHDYSHSDYDHHVQNHHLHGHHQRAYGSRDHEHHAYRHLSHDHGQNSKEQKRDNPVSVSICINPRKSKGKFYMPAICGDYNFEKNKVSIQFPDKYCRKREHSRDRKKNKEVQVKSDEENLNKRYDTPDRDGRNSHCNSSLKNGAVPICAGIIAGIQLCGPMSFGNSSGRMWRGNCC